MNTIKLDIQVNNKNYNFVFNNINDSDVKLNIDLPSEEDSQIDRNEMRSRIRFLEERLRISNRQAQNRQTQNRQAQHRQTQNRQAQHRQTQNMQLQNRQTQNRQTQNRQTLQQIESASMQQQITEINMLLRLLQDINNATNTTANTTTTEPINTTANTTANTTTTEPINTTANTTANTTTTEPINTTANINLPLLIDINQPTQIYENKNIIEETKQEIPQNVDNTDNNILTNDLFNFANFLSELSINPRRLYRDAGKINRAPIPVEECIINLQNYSTILREKPDQLNSYIEIAKAIDELIRNAMSCNDRLISRYGILIDLEYSKYMVKMCKKSSQNIFDKFLELTDFDIPGETREQAANRQKIKLIACNLRDGKLNDILHVLDTPGCICQFCN
jgi:hypothetical protein